MAISVLSRNRVACTGAARPCRRALVTKAYLPEGDKAPKKEPKHADEPKVEPKKEMAHMRRREPASVDMPMRRWTDSLATMQREMDAMLSAFDPFGRSQTFFEALSSDLLPGVAVRGGLGGMGRMIPIEIEETDQEYRVHAEVPGFTKEHIKVTVDGTHGILTISGQKSATEGKQQEQEGAQGSFRSAMTFKRTLSVPQDVDLDKPITGKTEHGLLTLVLPKGAVKSHIKEITLE